MCLPFALCVSATKMFALAGRASCLCRKDLPPASAEGRTWLTGGRGGDGHKAGWGGTFSFLLPKLRLLALPSQARNCLQKLREDISSKLDRDPGDSLRGQEIQVIGNGWWSDPHGRRCSGQSLLPVESWVRSLPPLPGKAQIQAMLAFSEHSQPS